MFNPLKKIEKWILKENRAQESFKVNWFNIFIRVLISLFILFPCAIIIIVASSLDKSLSNIFEYIFLFLDKNFPPINRKK